MFGLVKAERSAAGEMNDRYGAPSGFCDAAAFNAFGLQIFHGGLEVVAHQVKFVAGLFVCFKRMSSKLGRRRGEDEPAMAGIDRVEAKHVAKKSPDFFSVRSIEDGMEAGDHAKKHTTKECGNWVI